jgi:hypothetical protein
MLFSFAIGRFNNFNSPPMGVHQSAQCDRASLAQNYYYNGFNLFYPEVNENRCSDGIVSCELPLISYFSAISYQLFNFHEINFRIISFLFYTLGIWALFIWLRRYTNSLISFILLIIFNSSPILLFYANNFIPDAASLGLALMAFYLFFKGHIKHAFIPPSKLKLDNLLFVLCLGFSIAIKTTSIIHWISFVLLLSFSFIPQFKIELLNRKLLLIKLLFALIIPFSWYLWSRFLAINHNSEYFLMQIPKWENWETYQNALNIYLNNWPKQTFEIPILSVLLAGILFQLLFYKQKLSNLWFLSLINFGGVIAFMLVMMMQLRYHDYYIITLLPTFILNWIYLLSYIKTLSSNFVYLKILLIIILTIGANFQFNSGKKNLKERYTTGNYWEQSHQNADDYIQFREMIKPLNLDRNKCVLVGYDISPNNILYYLHLRGYRFNHDQNEEKLKSILSDRKVEFIISNDIKFESHIKEFHDLTLLKSYKNIKLFKINSSSTD